MTQHPAQHRDLDTDDTAPGEALDLIRCIGPHQLNRVTDTVVTVTYPVGATTVLSVQPDGTLDLRPEGSQGPYELAVLLVDRLVYAPLGAAGAAFLLPYADTIPNA
jgi:hypothetical protein